AKRTRVNEPSYFDPDWKGSHGWAGRNESSWQEGCKRVDESTAPIDGNFVGRVIVGVVLPRRGREHHGHAVLALTRGAANQEPRPRRADTIRYRRPMVRRLRRVLAEARDERA